MIDKPSSIRSGEEIEIPTLIDFLSKALNASITDLSLQQYPGGYSNLTYLVQFNQQEYVLRRPPIGANIKSAHDMSREFQVLTLLRKANYSKAPEPILLCDDASIIGSKFYLMKKVSGIILRNKIPKDLTLTPQTFNKLSKSAIDSLVELHQLNLTESGLIQLGKPEGYVARQVEGWIQRYEKSKTELIESMQSIAEWLKRNTPVSSEVAFIHNDFKYDNLVLDENDLTTVRAVLDWEMATVGDPLMDLGTTLAYWAETSDSDALKPFNLTWMEGNMNRAEALIYYQERMEKQILDIIFYYAFGTFKIGVICQQIYYRYKKGLTSDPRFASLIHVIKACGDNGRRAIDTQKI